MFTLAEAFVDPMDIWWDNLRPSMRHFYLCYNEEPQDLELFQDIEEAISFESDHDTFFTPERVQSIRYELEWQAW
jgi:hypothetical protein